jgi:hypothetical protein
MSNDIRNAFGIRLALDLVAGKIYATHSGLNSLFRANLDGGGGLNLGNLNGTLNLPVGVAVMPVLPFNCSLDIDGNGSIDALTDGLMLLRAMFGLTGTSVTNAAIGQGATRLDWAAIRGYTNTNCGSGFVQ